jgi:hypothetical protein
MPVNKAAICFNDSHGLVSFNNSGKTVTIPMCRKPPAVKGSIQLVFDSERNTNN